MTQITQKSKEHSVIVENALYQPNRGWDFTWNNYSDNDIEYITALPFKYLIYGKEKSPTNDTPHLQGFIYFKNERAFNPVRKMLHGASIRPVRCVEALIKYCKKKGTFMSLGRVHDKASRY